MEESHFFSWFNQNSAGIIAISALLISMVQLFYQRKHNRLSVKPHLTRFVHRNRDGDRALVAVQVINNGLGPAFIKKYETFKDGKPCYGNEAANELLKNIPCKKTITTLGDGYAMAAGEVKNLVLIEFDCSEDFGVEELINLMNRCDFIIHYESGYKEKDFYSSFEK